MPRLVGGRIFLTSQEVAQKAGIHRLTLLRWFRQGKLPEVPRDRNGWRLFSEEVTNEIVDYATTLERHASPTQGLLFPREKLPYTGR